MGTSAFFVSVGLLAAGCASVMDDSQRLDVEDNALGVASITIDRSDEPGASVFELRGLDADDHQVASVLVRTGEIADLHRHLPGADDAGTEITLSAAHQRHRVLSRELDLVQLDRGSEPTMQAFLELDTVSAALKQERIEIRRSVRAAEAAYTAESCPTEYLLTSPGALQCCYQSNTGTPQTVFFVSGGPNDGALSYRTQSPYGACKSQSGGSCSGTSCFWGPNGFARPQLFTCVDIPEEGYYCGGQMVWTNSGTCSGGWTNYAYPTLPNVTGTFSTTQGCPGGASGDGEWDY